MDHLGFIHEELDIKILILYILRRLPGSVDPNTLCDLCRDCDTGVGYFAYSDCLADLIDNGLIAESEEGLRITEKGANVRGRGRDDQRLSRFFKRAHFVKIALIYAAAPRDRLRR